LGGTHSWKNPAVGITHITWTSRNFKLLDVIKF
jgi:hypothetical protein